MSQTYPRSALPLSKKTEDSKVLREKQIGSTPVSLINKNIANKITSNQQRKAQLEAARNSLKRPGAITNENKTINTANTGVIKKTFRSTPISKGLLPKSVKSVASNQNDKLSTPVNRNIRSVFGSSAKQERSASKDNSARKRPLISGHRTTNTITTPLNRNYYASNSNSSAKAKQSPCHQNPIVNGKDYSAIMAKKKELGYTGTGYVVEYDCSIEDLKTIHVGKGLWKITTASTPNKNSMAFQMGAPQFASRLDVEASAPANTPGKSVFHNIDLNWNMPTKTNGILKNDHHPSRRLNLGDDYLNNSTAQSLDLETSLNQRNLPKKSLRWAEILEEKCGLDKIEEKFYSPAISSSPYHLTPKNIKQINMNLLTGSLTTNNSSDSKKGPVKGLRRSLSMNDINDIIITQDEDDTEKHDSIVNDSIDNKIPLIFSPAIKGNMNPMQTGTNLNETFELITPSKVLIENKPQVVFASDQEMIQEKHEANLENDNYTLNSIKTDQQVDECDNSLNELMIPFSLADTTEKSYNEEAMEQKTNTEKSSNEETMEQKTNTETSSKEETMEQRSEARIENTNKNQDLIEKLVTISASLTAGLVSMDLNTEESKLAVNTVEYIKISNVVNEIETSLRIYKNKLAFN